MRPLRIEGYTRELAMDQPEYAPLCIRDAVTVLEISEDQVLTAPTMVAAFEPTPGELALLNAGGRIHISILGVFWPPCRLSVEPPPS